MVIPLYYLEYQQPNVTVFCGKLLQLNACFGPYKINLISYSYSYAHNCENKITS